MLRECPPGIDADSAAYRLGGFGSHENLMYYDLVRHTSSASPATWAS